MQRAVSKSTSARCFLVRELVREERRLLRSVGISSSTSVTEVSSSRSAESAYPVRLSSSQYLTQSQYIWSQSLLQSKSSVVRIQQLIIVAGVPGRRQIHFHLPRGFHALDLGAVPVDVPHSVRRPGVVAHQESQVVVWRQANSAEELAYGTDK